MERFKEIDQALDKLKIDIKNISPSILEKIEEDIDLRFSHESTKIEGNTLSIYEVKTLLVDKTSIGGKDLREIYEVVNHKKAFDYIKSHLEEDLDEELIKDLHQILMDNIFSGGIYRNGNVRITGASFSPPSWEAVRQEMKNFIEDYKIKKENTHPVELAAWVHAEFIRIHPFQDGNGRSARLLLNFILMKRGYLPIVIEAKNRPAYYQALDNYGREGDLGLFLDMVRELELGTIGDYLK
ncbi:MAG: Fic family protein [Peptoniphilus sp.]|uniref:Fic family protein n=1 Tax=Peptoniphilus sp. TaxID=1971214 RepID=UPI00399B0FBC